MRFLEGFVFPLGDSTSKGGAWSGLAFRGFLEGREFEVGTEVWKVLFFCVCVFEDVATYRACRIPVTWAFGRCCRAFGEFCCRFKSFVKSVLVLC